MLQLELACPIELEQVVNKASKLAANLNLVLVLQQGCFHDVPKHKSLGFHLKMVPSELCNPVPVSSHHRFVCHHLKQGA